MGRLRAGLTGRNRAFGLWITACALILRIVMPAGWMPMTGADGLTRITLCTGQGMVEAFVDRSGALHDQRPDDSGSKGQPKTDQPCAFAGLGLAAAEPHVAALDTPIRIAAASAPSLPAAVAIGHGLAAPPPPATGPPATL